MQVAASQVGLSSPNITESNFIWKISDFDRLKRKLELLSTSIDSQGNFSSNIKDVIESPIFSTKQNDLKWCLVMFSTSNQLRASNFGNGHRYLSFEFRNKNSRFFYANVNYSITIEKNGVKYNSLEKSRNCIMTNDKISFERPSCVTDDRVVCNFIRLDELFNKNNCYLIDNELHVVCDYKIFDYGSDSVTTLDDDLFNRIVLDRFEKQWNDRELCDYELIAPCGRKLLAHKFVLSAGSPVFSAMLKNDMKMKRDDSLKIKEISYEALKEMLHFLYSGKIEINYETVSDILAAAEKYQIGHLKQRCKEFLVKNLTCEHAVMTLKLSKLYDMTDIQDQVNAFVKSNTELIFFNHTSLTMNNKIDCYVKVIQDMAEKMQ